MSDIGEDEAISFDGKSISSYELMGKQLGNCESWVSLILVEDKSVVTKVLCHGGSL